MTRACELDWRTGLCDVWPMEDSVDGVGVLVRSAVRHHDKRRGTSQTMMFCLHPDESLWLCLTYPRRCRHGRVR